MSYDLYQIGGDAYLQRNIWAMNKIRWVLHECGAFGRVVADSELKWPEKKPAPSSDHFDGDTGKPLTDEAREFVEMQAIALAYHPEDLPPPHKFCSNDGWIVTPGECRAMLIAIQSQDHPVNDEDSNRWAEFVRFIGICAETGGFRVL